MKNNKDEILARITGNYRESYEALGVQFKGHSGGVEHPFHCPCNGHKNGDKRPAGSLNIESGLWNCNKMKIGGDIFEMAGLIYGLTAFPDKLAKVADVLGLGFPAAVLKTPLFKLPYIPPAKSNGAAKSAIPGWVDEYIYKDEREEILYHVLRYPPAKNGEKYFSQGRYLPSGEYDHSTGAMKGVRYILYRLNEIQGKQQVYIAEGEKDVNTLWDIGFPATTNCMGAGAWKDDYAAQLVSAGAKLASIFPDNNEIGIKHAEDVAKSCIKVGIRCAIITLPDLPPGEDISYWLDDGHSPDELRQILKASKEYRLKSPIICLADVEPEDVEWLWPPYIPLRKITMLEGDPGVGKSWLSLAIAKIVSLGDSFLGGASFGPANVLLFSAEDGLGDTIRPRLDALGADVSRIHAWEPVVTFDTEGLAVIEKEIARLEPSLVIIDPIVAYVGAGTDINRANAVRAILAPLAKIAEKYNVAILVLRHLRKDESTKGIYRGLGSIDFTAAARSVLLVGKDPQIPEAAVIVHIKSNLAKEGSSIGFTKKEGKFEWTGESELTSGDILAGDPQKGGSLAKEEAIAFLHDILSEGPIEATEVFEHAKSLGISKSTLRRVKKELNVTSSRKGFGEDGKYHWALPSIDDQNPHPESLDTYGENGHLCEKPESESNTSEEVNVWESEGSSEDSLES